MRYDDFVLQITSSGPGRYTARVLQSPAGEGSDGFALPSSLVETSGRLAVGGRIVRGGDGDEGIDGDTATERHAAVDGEAPPSAGATADGLGDDLFGLVFAGQVRSLYDRSIGKIESDPGRALRIKLKLDPSDPELAKLHHLPWELLREEGDYVGLSRMRSIVRYLDVPKSTPTIELPDVLRVLIVVSKPSSMASLDVDKETQGLRRAWERNAALEPIFLERATLRGLRDTLLEKRCHVLHFIGHGSLESASGEGVVHLEGEGGVDEPVSGIQLATALGGISHLRMVFLNACSTARSGSGPFVGMADALVRGGVPAVLAMQFPISDPAAIELSTTFYSRLASGDPIDAALSEGRHAVHSHRRGTVEWATPVLFMRVADGTLFSPRTTPPPDLTLETTPTLPRPEPPRSKGPGGWVKAAALALTLTTAGGVGWVVWENLPTAPIEPDTDESTDPSPTSPDDFGDTGSVPGGGSIEPDPVPRRVPSQPDPTPTESQKTQDTPVREPPSTPPAEPEPEPEPPPPPTIQLEPGETVAFSSSRPLRNSVAGLESKVVEIERLPNGRQRLIVELVNGSGRPLTVAFDDRDTALSDQGRSYRVMDSGTLDPTTPVASAELPAGAKRRFWFEFSTPRREQQSFMFMPAATGAGAPRFYPAQIAVEDGGSTAVASQQSGGLRRR